MVVSSVKYSEPGLLKWRISNKIEQTLLWLEKSFPGQGKYKMQTQGTDTELIRFEEAVGTKVIWIYGKNNHKRFMVIKLSVRGHLHFYVGRAVSG